MSLTTTLDFSATNRSIWAPGISNGFSYSFDAFHTSLHNSKVVDLFGPVDPYFSANFESGIKGSVSASLGSFNLSYPISVNAEFANSVANGQAVTISTSSYTVSPASLSLTSPGLSASLDILLKGDVSAGINGPLSSSVTAGFDFSKSLQPGGKLIDSKYGSLSLAAPAPFVATASSSAKVGALPALTASGQTNPFLSANLDLDALATTVAALGGITIPPLSGSFNIKYAPLNIDLKAKYDLLDVDLLGDLSLGQALTFQPTVVAVDMSYNGQHKTGVLGDSFTFTAPSTGSGTMQVNASYSLNGTVSTRTGVIGTAMLRIKEFQLDASAIGSFAGLEFDLPQGGVITGLTDYNSITRPFTDIIGTRSVAYSITYGGGTPISPIAPSDDYAIDSSQTTGRLTVNGPYVHGTLEVASDRDWFRADLMAGQHYRFELDGKASGQGLTLDKPFMSLREAADPDKRILSIDSKGQGVSFLDFTPASSESVFLVVGGDLVTGGGYQLKAFTVGGAIPSIVAPTPTPPAQYSPIVTPGSAPVGNTSAIFATIADNSVREGPTGTLTTLSFGVTLSGPGVGTKDVTIQYAVGDVPGSGSNATSSQDYLPASGTLVIPASQTSASIDVKVVGDYQLEPDEVLRVTLSQPSTGVTLLNSFATGTIINDDQPQNHLPVTGYDLAVTSPGTPIVMDVLANDYDPDGDNLTIQQIFNTTSGATYTIQNNKVLVTPQPGFIGMLSYQYVVEDSRGGARNSGFLAQLMVSGDGSPGIGNPGTASDDIIVGGAGNDILLGDAGNDIIAGGPGSDQIDGGSGFNYLDLRQAAHGANMQFADPWIWDDGDGGRDILKNIQGVLGTPYVDIISGASGNAQYITTGYRIFGYDGNDRIRTDAGDDVLDGGAGDDELIYGAGHDLVYGGPGNDVVYSFNGVNDTVGDEIHGGDGNDNIAANLSRSPDVIFGENGDDYLAFSDGDTVWGGAGADTFRLGGFLSGLDVVHAYHATIADLSIGDSIGWNFPTPVVTNFHADYFVGPISPGTGVSTQLDHVEWSTDGKITTLYFGYDSLPGADFVLDLNGVFTLEQLSVDASDSLSLKINILGQGFALSPGDDLVVAGGSGDDLYDGGDGTNTIDYTSTSLGVVIDMSGPAGVATGPEIGRDQFAHIQNAIGGNGADRFIGSGFGNVLDGGGGDDHISGGLGGDTLAGRGGTNVLDGGGGRDIATYQLASSAATIVHMAPGQTIITGPGFADTLSGVEVAHFTDRDVSLQTRSRADMTGDGISDIAWFNSSAGAVSFYELGSNGFSWHDIGSVASGYVPLSGDFNGDGLDDLTWWNQSNGLVSTYLTNPSGGYTWRNIGQVAPGYAPSVGDFNGDGVSDLLWWNSTTGQVSTYLINPQGGYTWRNVGLVAPGYQPLVGDVSGDGVSDIVWWKPSTGDVSYYEVNGASGAYAWHGIGVVAPGYSPQMGDVTGDGRDDIVWWNQAAGLVSDYDINPSGGFTWHPYGNVAPGYSPVVRDASGDGLADIIWSDGTHVSMYQTKPLGAATAYEWHNIGLVSPGYNPVS